MKRVKGDEWELNDQGENREKNCPDILWQLELVHTSTRDGDGSNGFFISSMANFYHAATKFYLEQRNQSWHIVAFFIFFGPLVAVQYLRFDCRIDWVGSMYSWK